MDALTAGQVRIPWAGGAAVAQLGVQPAASRLGWDSLGLAVPALGRAGSHKTESKGNVSLEPFRANKIPSWLINAPLK